MKSLKGKLLLITGCIMAIIATILTIISIQNARVTYGNQFSLNIGDDLRFSVNDKELILDGKDDVGDIFSFIGDLAKGKGSSSKKSFLQKANMEFAKQSIVYMIIVCVIGIIALYLVLRRALRPIKQLEERIRNVDDTNLSEPVIIETKDREIISLANSFNSMRTKLDDSFQMQKNFAANAAHELKTPLATMKAGIQVLQLEEQPTIEEYKETIDVMEQSTKRLIQVVEDLLDFTKEDNNGYEDCIVLSDVFDIVKDELELTATDKGVEIVSGCLDGVMKGNQVLIYRVLFNLVENAIKYNQKGGKVTITSIITENNLVQITIADTGIGMQQEELNHIFEPFYRVDKSRSRDMGGSGLGLSIVKKIVEKHNGAIKVSSKLGVGTTFVLLFENKSYK